MFDAALLESGPSRRVHTEGAGLPYAIATHLVLIGAFVGASLWTVGDPAEPETRFPVFPTFLSPPAPPPPGGGNPTPSRPPIRNVQVPLTSFPPDLPAPEEELPGPAEAGVDGTVPGTGPGLPGYDGVDGGTGTVPGALPGEPDEPEAIQRPGGDVTFPVLVWRVEPGYPESMRRARMEGTLILEAVITAAGDVQDVRVLKSINPLLDAAAAQAVRQWRYRPATRNGRAVPVYLTVTVRFSLND